MELRPRLPAFVLALVLTAGSALAQSRSNGIAAVVNGKPVTRSELADNVKATENIIRALNQNDPAKMARELVELRSNALDALIDRELILAEFAKVGGVIKSQYIDDQINNIVREAFKGNRDELVSELAKAGMSIKKFRELQEKMIISNVMRQKHAGEQAPPTPREVEEYYAKNVDKWRVGDQIKISTITIPKLTAEPGSTPAGQKKLAQEVRTKVTGGADFASTARAYSQDSRAEFGGAWEWMPRTELMPAIANAAMDLKVGGVSPVLEQETSYIIVSCDAKKLGEAPALEKIRGDVQKMVQQEKSRKAVDEWMETLRKKAVIRKF